MERIHSKVKIYNKELYFVNKKIIRVKVPIKKIIKIKIIKTNKNGNDNSTKIRYKIMKKTWIRKIITATIKKIVFKVK